MATITLKQTTFGCTIGMGAFEGIGVAFSSLKQSTSNLTEALGSLKTKIGLASIGVNVSESQEQTKAAHEREKNKKSSLSLAYDKLSALISNVSSVDIKASSKIRERKETFYDRYYYLRAPLKTPSEKKQLCTASAASSPLVVRKHAFDGFSCIYCTYLLFLTQNGFLEVPLKPECEKTKKEKRKDKRAERW